MTVEEKAREYAFEGWEKSQDPRVIANPIINEEKYISFIDGYHECEKEHEWHKVSEVGLPKESGRYFVYVGGGENGVYPLDFDTEAKDFGYWCLDVGANLGVRDTIFETVTERNEDKVIAWKEIVPPKEIE